MLDGLDKVCPCEVTEGEWELREKVEAWCNKEGTHNVFVLLWWTFGSQKWGGWYKLDSWDFLNDPDEERDKDLARLVKNGCWIKID